MSATETVLNVAIRYAEAAKARAEAASTRWAEASYQYGRAHAYDDMLGQLRSARQIVADVASAGKED